jgi:glycosyltransferase involved in cell wall biosynthesis
MRISVCIPTYNGEKYIKEQLVSILVQLSALDEIIISDDSSTDTTIEIIKSLQDARIKLFKKNNFKSPIFNLENALKYASGDFIFLADQDDIWEPDKVKVTLEKLIKSDLVVSDCSLIDASENLVNASFYELNKTKSGYLNNLIKNGFLGCCMAFNSKIKESVLPFPKKIAMHDIWIGLTASLVGKVDFIEDKLIRYRRHGDNFSFTSAKSKFSLTYKLTYRFYFLFHTFKRLFLLKSIK